MVGERDYSVWSPQELNVEFNSLIDQFPYSRLNKDYLVRFNLALKSDNPQDSENDAFTFIKSPLSEDTRSKHMLIVEGLITSLIQVTRLTPFGQGIVENILRGTYITGFDKNLSEEGSVFYLLRDRNNSDNGGIFDPLRARFIEQELILNVVNNELQIGEAGIVLDFGSDVLSDWKRDFSKKYGGEP